MKKITTTVMLFAALLFGFTACQNEKKKAEVTTIDETHSEGDGHNHDSESKDENAHVHDSTKSESHLGHDHAAVDTTHDNHEGHNH
jgi:hypothetical protein